jgi:HK97 family phage major capsid protein
MSFTAATTNSAAAWRPDQFSFQPEDVLPAAAILVASSVVGRIEGDQPSVRVANIDDDSADFVAEGAPIDESEPALNEAVVYTRKIAQLIRLTNEQYRQNLTPDRLSNSVQRALTRKANSAFLSQPARVSPDVAPATGIINWPGVVSATGVTTNLDKLIDLEATIRANLGQPGLWLMAPDTWAALRKMKVGTDFNSTLLGAGTDDATPMLLSLPVIVNAGMLPKAGVLIDPTAIVSAVSQVLVATSDQTYFTSDSVGIRATWRTGHSVVRPDRIGVFSLATSYTVTLGSPSAGTFTLTFSGLTTATITYNAPTAAAVKGALFALDDGFDASDWTVSGSNGGPFTIVTPGGVLTGSGAGLTGGTFSVTAA